MTHEQVAHVHSEACQCIFPGCVAWWRHSHGGFPGGCDDPADPSGPPRIFDVPDPAGPDALRDLEGGLLRRGQSW